ncbi:MAG: hypothetical protein PSN34_06910 [Urechidicola sp.]|nr:hypothetical protein [Urechidicola sp.]
MSDKFLQATIKEAKMGLQEGGIPIGSVLVYDGKIIGQGHNKRIQKGSVLSSISKCNILGQISEFNFRYLKF